jgi:ArsR family transcriptional regulator
MNMRSYVCCQSKQLDSPEIDKLRALLAVIGEQSRLQMLCILRQGQHCVCELAAHTKQSQSLVSHHLKDLKDAGLVESETKGRFYYYSLTKKGEDISTLLFSLKKVL